MPDHTPIGTDSLVIDMARRFATERLAPGAAAREKAGAIEPEIIRELGELGIFGATTPAQWDGSEIDPVTYALLLEEIAAGDGSVSTMVSVHNSPTCIIFDQYGTDAQKDRWLRPLATGAAVGSFALTEPQAGSDASNLKTRAVKKGDRYVINGAKQFISSGGVPGSTVLFAVTDPSAGRKGISCFVVDKATPGYVVVRREEKLGQKASRDLRAGVRGHGGAGGPAHRRRGRRLQDRAVHAGERPYRHRGAERRDGARGAGLRGGVRQGAAGVRRADH